MSPETRDASVAPAPQVRAQSDKAHVGAAEIVSRWLAALDADGPPDIRLRYLADAHLRLIEAAPELPAHLIARALSKDPVVRALPRRLTGLLRLLIEGTIEAGQLTGRFRGEADPREAAQTITSAIQGMIVRWLLAGRRFDLAERGQRTLTPILCGLTAVAPRRGGRP